MVRQCKNSTLSAALVLAVICVFVASAASSPVFAQSPRKATCGGDVYDKLKCRQEALHGQLKHTDEVVFGDETELGKLAQEKGVGLSRLKNAKEKAKRAKEKITKEHYRKQAKKETRGNNEKAAGHLVPLNDDSDDGDPKGVANDGICDREQGDNTAECASIELLDGQAQPCNPEKKNKGRGGGSNDKFRGYECDRWYETNELDSDEDEEAKQAAEQLEATYSATEDDLIVMNDSLDIVNEALEQKPATASTATTGCEVIDPAPVELVLAVNTLRAVKATSFGAARIASSATGQGVVVWGFGGNARAWAQVFDAIAMAADIAYIMSDLALKEWESLRQAAILNCVGETAVALETMRQEIHDEHELIEELLCTPQGQRPEWPFK